MRAFVISEPGRSAVLDVRPPVAGPGEVVARVGRAGICGTDGELFSGEMAYLHDGSTHYPVRIGHEWMGTVTEVGDGVDPAWLGRRITGDTMIGCGVCTRCRDGRQRVCASRDELGIRDGRPGALAERIAVPLRSVHELPDEVDDAMGAMVEPGGNALRSVRGARLRPGDRVLVLGAGTIGLLAAMFARADGADVHLMGRSARSLEFARRIGFEQVWTRDALPELAWDAVIDASDDPAMPAFAVDLVEPSKRVVLVGLAGSASLVDTRAIALKDVTAVGILSASGGLEGTIAAYASGAVDPRPLIATTVGLDEVGLILAGNRPEGAGAGPKFQVRVEG